MSYASTFRLRQQSHTFPSHTSISIAPNSRELHPSSFNASAMPSPIEIHTCTALDTDISKGNCAAPHLDSVKDTHQRSSSNSGKAFRKTVLHVPNATQRAAELRKTSNALSKPKCQCVSGGIGTLSHSEAKRTESPGRNTHTGEQIKVLMSRRKKDEHTVVALMQRCDSQLCSSVEGDCVEKTMEGDLQNALHERNQALRLLHFVQTEGNAVAHRMREKLVRQKEVMDALVRENAKLRNSCSSTVSLNHMTQGFICNEEEEEEEGYVTAHAVPSSKELREAMDHNDTISHTSSVRSNSVQDKESTYNRKTDTKRLSEMHEAGSHVTSEPSVDFKHKTPFFIPQCNAVEDIPKDSAVEEMELLRDTVSALQVALRTEKQQRIEREKFFHKISEEYEHRVALLEQQLRHKERK